MIRVCSVQTGTGIEWCCVAVSSWMMAVLAVCGTLGVVGFLLIGISLCMWRYKTTTGETSRNRSVLVLCPIGLLSWQRRPVNQSIV